MKTKPKPKELFLTHIFNSGQSLLAKLDQEVLTQFYERLSSGDGGEPLISAAADERHIAALMEGVTELNSAVLNIQQCAIFLANSET